MQRQRTQIEYSPDLHENIGEHYQDRIIGPGCSTESFLQELRHGIKTIAQVVRQEDPQQGIEPKQYCSPFCKNGHKAAAVGHAHGTHQLVTADIGSHDATSYHPPGQLISRQEIILFGITTLGRSIEPEGQHSQNIDTEYGSVQYREF